MTSQRPTLRWELPGGTDGAHVELCADRACSKVLAEFDAQGTSGSPEQPLPPGVAFWRLTALQGQTRGTMRSPVWQFTVGARTAEHATSWGSVPDFNGDGFADLVVGASAATLGEFNRGAVYVYLGGSGGLAASPSLTLTLEPSEEHFVCLGTRVESAGDLNGDGFADLLVEATCEQKTLVFFGGPSGPAAKPQAEVWTNNYDFFPCGDTDGDGYGDLVLQAGPHVVHGGTGELKMEPIGPGLEGFMFIGAGDTNGDGLGDMAAMTSLGSSFSLYPGAVNPLYPGAPKGVGAAVTLTVPDVPYPIDPVVGAADIDGDGLRDVLLAKQRWGTPPGAQPSPLYVYAGRAQGVAPAYTIALPIDRMVRSAGDVNGDGYEDLLLSGHGEVRLLLGGASGPTEANTLTGPPGFGEVAVGLGDVDGDGFGDVAVGNDAGGVLVYRGSAAGLSATPSYTLQAPVADSGFGAFIAGLR